MVQTVPLETYPPEEFERRGVTEAERAALLPFNRKSTYKYDLGLTPLLLGSIAVVLLAAAYFLRFLTWNFDDSYIVFRIVRNLLEGFGWTYNPGELHNASTSVLNTLLTAGVALLGFSIPEAAHIAGLASLVLLGLASLQILGKAVPGALAIPASLSLVVLAATSSTWGIETSLLLALLFLYILREMKGKSPWVCLSLLVLTRPDCLALLGTRGLFETYRQRRLPWGAIGVCSVIIGPWCLFSLVTFGQLFPDTLASKVWQGQSGFWGGGAVYWRGLTSHPFAGLGPLPGLTLLFAGVGFLFSLFSAPYRPEAKGILFVSGFILFQQATYLVLNVPGYHWYFVPLEAVVLFLAWYGTGRLVEKSTRFKKVSVSGSATIVVALFLLLSSGLLLYDSSKLPSVVDQRDAAYQAAISSFEAETKAPGAIATLEVGTIGFFSSRRIIDLIGLTTPNPEFLTTRHLDEFFVLRPQFVLLHEPAWPHEMSIQTDPRFLYLYEKKQVYHHPFTTLVTFSLRPERQSDVFTPELLKTILAERYSEPSQVEQGFDTLTTEEGTLCILDTINGTPGGGVLVVERTRPLHVVGWGVTRSAAAGEQPATLFFSNGKEAYAVEVSRLERPDVAAHLMDESQLRAGFSAITSLFSLPAGSYQLLLRTERAGQEVNYSFCNLGQTIVVPSL